MVRHTERLRNDVAWVIANFCIDRVATGVYREYLKAIIGEGQRRWDEAFWQLYDEQHDKGKVYEDAGGRDNEEVA